ncbi:putative outer membrane protein probably involved in nutrient binding [Polaribacter irgensii 23-P]|uniref:Putative outer membrane protein probably involved in nutrient binding n=1 Tax=Polaribacter irgensii 23-P TaxID=313594 RepID=A4BY82_9FLAO|nr:RagB/SusD family nutrient uptake outer membrane protein [Polaribacter irgensii]EAR13923.1 putative outer membrane protein probably involved in nutrient binding [Polaribacter irgensii 23-P]
MKKYISVLILALFGLTGCENFLEEQPKGEPTNANFWKTEADVISATTALYIFNDYQGIYGRGMNLYSLVPSDDFVVGKPKSQIEEIKDFITSGNGSYTRDIWPMHFIVIKRANDIIRNVTDLDINAEVKNFALGEAYFMRGLAYFQLSLLYGDDNSGGIPIIDETVAEDFFIERPASVSISYAFAAASFEKAAELLPYFNAADSERFGRPHKNAALGYLARTHLHNAEYNAASWDIVITACDQVINSNKNALETNFKDAFKIASNWGPEYLWSVPSNTVGGSMFAGASLENRAWGKYNGWGYFAPTKELYDSYETGDERRDATLLAFGDEFEFFGSTRKYASANNLTGFQLKKFLEPYGYASPIHLNPNGDHPSTDLNLPLLRYSHILLMKAEALIVKNGAGSGDTEINLVRARAGLAAKTGATLEDLKSERRAEFAGELLGRYEDLCRWGDVAKIKGALHGKRHLGVVFDTSEGENKGFPVNSTDFTQNFPTTEVWKERSNFILSTHRIWPIPANAIDTSRETLSQNKGW